VAGPHSEAVPGQERRLSTAVSAERCHFQLGYGWLSFVSAHMSPTQAMFSEDNMGLEK